MKYKIGLLCTHPIQYYSPLFRFLAKMESVDLKVFYSCKPSLASQGEGFGVSFSWDVDLLSGYSFRWLNNQSSRPSLSHFGGCDTPEIRSIISKEKFDSFLVLGWNSKSYWQAMKACWDFRIPLMVRGDSHLHYPPARLKNVLKKPAYSFFIRRFHACLAVGAWSEEYFRYYGARCVIRSPHCVDNDWFGIKSAECKSLALQKRKEFGVAEDGKVFLFAGKFEKKKRPLDFLMAIKKIHDLPKFKGKVFGYLVGDGVLRKDCEDFALTHKLPVRFEGFLNQSQMPLAYALSDCLVLPSDGRETWGLVVNEAMACGVPAIVSDQVGCRPDLIHEGKTGFVFTLGNTVELAEKMGLACSQTHALGQNAEVLIAEYSIEAASESIRQALHSTHD